MIDNRHCHPDTPTLFLDYDGVLHPDEVYRIGERIVLRMDGFNLFEWAPVLEELLVPHPELSIVLSTSWVRLLGFEVARAWLPKGLQERVVGTTWHPHVPSGWERLPRHEQVLRDVRKHGRQRWIAIDDDGADWPTTSRDKLVLTDSLLGLGVRSAQEELREKLSSLYR